MIPRLFESTATTFDDYGLCPLADCISCFVTEERNGEFSLSMEYPRDGQFATELAVDRIVLADPYDNAPEPEPFRIYEITYDMNGNITVNAQHISYELNYVIISKNSETATSPSQYWTNENTHVIGSNPFSFSSNISAGTSRDIGCTEPTSMRSMLGGVEGSMLDNFGGEFRWNRYNVELLSARGSDNGVKIAYSKNLTGLEYDIDLTDVFTGVVAFWADEETYIESDLQQVQTNPYGFNRNIVVDASSDFDTAPTKAALNTWAANYLSNHTTTPKISVDAEFVPLWQTEEYKEFYALEHVALCDVVTVQYSPLNLGIKAKVMKTVYDVLADRYHNIVISTLKQTLADTIFDLMQNETSGSGSTVVVHDGASVTQQLDGILLIE